MLGGVDLLLFLCGDKMNGNKLLFVNVNIDYLKALHDVDSEVQYSDEGYIRKPFLGILLLNNYKQYVVPLSSVKEKHLHWKKRYSDGRYLVTEIISRSSITQNAIYKEIGSAVSVERIYAALDVKKMIPVREDLYTTVSFAVLQDDSKSVVDYKILQEKEYRACVKIFDDIKRHAQDIYNKQMSTGKIQKFCCDYGLLERTMKKKKKKKAPAAQDLTPQNTSTP